MGVEGNQIVWMMPLVILYLGMIYACILLVGAVYGFTKGRSSLPSFFRDLLIVIEVVLSCHYGIKTGHWGAGLLGMGFGCILSLTIHSREFSKTQDMAPFGHLTAISVLVSLFDVSGILTCDRL